MYTHKHTYKLYISMQHNGHWKSRTNVLSIFFQFFCETATTNALAVSAADWRTDMWRAHAYCNTQLWWMPAKPFGRTRQFANKPPNHSTADNWNRIVSALNAGSSSTWTHRHTLIEREQRNRHWWLNGNCKNGKYMSLYLYMNACSISAGTSVVL